MSEDKTIKLGDLFWAKVGSHPWWPCMIFYDPSGDDFTLDHKRFHVQFLGPIHERAWVSVNYLIPFNGREGLDKNLKELASNPNSKLPKNKFELKIRDAIREQWDESWKEADIILKLPHEQRLSKYGRLSDEAKKRIIPEAQKDNLTQLMNNVTMTLDEEEEAFNNFVNEEIDITPVDSKFNSESLTVELKKQWTIMSISNKRKFLLNPLNMFRVKQVKSRSSIAAPRQTGGLTAGNESRPSEKKKTTKKEAKEKPIENNLEIHRLIVSPAQYRNQPVCQQCEIYSPKQMLQCTGKCRGWYHPSCAKYKTLPSFDKKNIHKPETFLCPDCISGDYRCSLCQEKSATDSPLITCSFNNCSRQYHKSCIMNDTCAIYVEDGERLTITRCSTHVCNTCVKECLHPDAHHGLINSERAKRKSDATGGFLTADLYDERLTGKELLQCVRCPAVFHTGDLCTPAGSIELSLSHIVCPKHFVKNLNISYRTLNMLFCSYCHKSGGERINCHSCPNSYHTSCLRECDPQMKRNRLVDASLTCSRCLFEIQPRYSQLVWAKVSGFRWWPVEVIHPRNAPINILQMSHPEGSFPIHFPASDEYQWIARSRVYAFEIGFFFKGNTAPATNRFEKAFHRALSVVNGMHSMYVNHVWNRSLPYFSINVSELPASELVIPSNFSDSFTDTSKKSPIKVSTSGSKVIEKQSPSKNLPPTFVKIAKNEFSPLIKEEIEGLQKEFKSSTKCTCPLDESQQGNCNIMGDDACVNASSLIECQSKINCVSEVGCQNRQFKRLSEKPFKVSVFKTTNRGFGLKAENQINMNSLVIEVIGEVINYQEAFSRLQTSIGIEKNSFKDRMPNFEDSKGDTTMVKLTKNYMLDLSKKSNESRFINHSCEANLYPETWHVNGVPRIGLFADRDISQGEELTVNYVEISLISARMLSCKSSGFMCLCGADVCKEIIKANMSFLTTTPSATTVTNPSANSLSAVSTLNVSGSSSLAREFNEENIKPNLKVITQSSPGAANRALSAQKRNEQNRNPNMLKIPTGIPPAEKGTLASLKTDEDLANTNDGNVSEEETRSNTNNQICPSDVVDQWNLPKGVRAHEDFCFRCGDGGELMLCDKSGCYRSFHLTCLGLSGPPRGIWFCPWHYCDTCGQPSTKLCLKCPNSFCNDHYSLLTAEGRERMSIYSMDKQRFAIAHNILNTKVSGEANEAEAERTREIGSRCIAFSCRWVCYNHSNNPQPCPTKATLSEARPPSQAKGDAQNSRKRQLDESQMEPSEPKRQRTLLAT